MLEVWVKGGTFGKVISEVARKAPRGPTARGFRNAMPLSNVKDPTARVALEMVDRLREELD